MYTYPLTCEDCGTELGHVDTDVEKTQEELALKSGMICESCAVVRNEAAAQLQAEEQAREEVLETIIDTHLDQAPSEEVPTEEIPGGTK